MSDQDMDKESSMYAVFFIKDSKWTLWETYQSKRAADEEKKYLVSGLGLRAEVFARSA
jgi:hypothetical protein